MPLVQPTLCWTESLPPEEISDAQTLRRRLSEVALRSTSHPIIATLESRPYTISIGLGRSECTLLVQEERGAGGIAHEWFAIGDSSRDGHVEFWIHGEHHSEFASRHLLPASAALDAAIEFVETYKLSLLYEWEENTF